MFVNYFFYITDVMLVAIFAWHGVYTCVRGGFVVGPFCDVCEVLNGLLCGLYDWYS